VWNITVKSGDYQFTFTVGGECRGNPPGVRESLAELIFEQLIPRIQGETLGPVFCRKAPSYCRVSREIECQGLSTTCTCTNHSSERAILTSQADNPIGGSYLEACQVPFFFGSSPD
jgi:hypothetical protein